MSSHSVRNVPQQSRSQQRVDAILDTAAQVFIEVGYEAATTNAIAERAGISIGTLYRYFSDKSTILQTLAARYYKEEQELFDGLFTDDVVYLPLSVLVDRLVTPFVEMYNANPVYAYILLGKDVSSDIAFATREIEKGSIERLTDIVQRVVPHLDREQAALTAMLCKATVKSLISLRSASPDEDLDEDLKARLTDEIKQMLLAYLEKIMDKSKD